MNSGTCFVDSERRACFKSAVSGCLELLPCHEAEKEFMPELVYKKGSGIEMRRTLNHILVLLSHLRLPQPGEPGLHAKLAVQDGIWVPT
jgi:hypothetical protein